MGPVLVQRLAPLLEVDQAVLFRPARTPAGWSLDVFAASEDRDSRLRAAIVEYLGGAPPRFTSYDPDRVRAADRNRLVTIDPRQAPPSYHRIPIVRDLYPRIGFAGQCEARVLVSDGPALTAWLGGFRARPFRPAELQFVSALAAPLRARLRLEQQLAATRLYRQTLFHAMEALEAPAFLVCGETIEHANAAGRTRLHTEAGTRAELLGSLEVAGASCFAVEAAGLPPLKLVTLPATGIEPGRVVEQAVTRWRLSPRQAEVLTHLLDGDTNKQIAAKLGCAEVTVEFHLRGMFLKTSTENRTELLAQCLKVP